jgi:hypothetical protein
MRILYRVSNVSFSIGVEIVATMGVKMDLVFIQYIDLVEMHTYILPNTEGKRIADIRNGI